MTARSKVTLVEAQRIRVYLIEHAQLAESVSYLAEYAQVPESVHLDVVTEAVDRLLALGLIDTDAALRALEGAAS